MPSPFEYFVLGSDGIGGRWRPQMPSNREAVVAIRPYYDQPVATNTIFVKDLSAYEQAGDFRTYNYNTISLLEVIWDVMEGYFPDFTDKEDRFSLRNAMLAFMKHQIDIEVKSADEFDAMLSTSALGMNDSTDEENE